VFGVAQTPMWISHSLRAGQYELAEELHLESYDGMDVGPVE
jgi:hypothetical protein